MSWSSSNFHPLASAITGDTCLNQLLFGWFLNGSFFFFCNIVELIFIVELVFYYKEQFVFLPIDVSIIIISTRNTCIIILFNGLQFITIITYFVLEVVNESHFKLGIVSLTGPHSSFVEHKHDNILLLHNFPPC